MLYSSISNSKIKDLKKLNTKKYRDLSGLFLVDGEHLVLEAYKSGYLDELILLEGSSFSLDVLMVLWVFVERRIILYRVIELLF